MPRFVILTHDWPVPHWDLLVEFQSVLVEAGRVLRAWRLLAEPAAGADVPTEPNFDHRPLYLDYEGPVSGGRGSVSRWDTGSCEWLADEPDHIEIELRGAKLAGRAAVRRTGTGWAFRLTGPAG